MADPTAEDFALAWGRYYDGLPADLRRKLSIHDFKRIGDCFKTAFAPISEAALLAAEKRGGDQRAKEIATWCRSTAPVCGSNLRAGGLLAAADAAIDTITPAEECE